MSQSILTIDDLVDELSSHSSFVTMANYGDGEWSCLLGEVGWNCNGDRYYAPGLRDALEETFTPPLLTHYGFNPGRKHMEAAQEWLRKKGYSVPTVGPCSYRYRSGRTYASCRGIESVENGENTIPWVWKEIVSGSNCKGEFGPFLRLCKKRRVLVVGGAHLARLTVFTHKHLVTPPHNTWDVAEEVIAEIWDEWAKHGFDLALFACGLASNALIWRLGKMGVCAHLIDVGAALDPYVGVLSRKTYKQPAFQEKLHRSIKEAG